MRRYAMTIAIIGFFVLSGVGCLCGVPVGVCAMRGVVGAAVLYVLTTLAGKIILGIVVEAMVSRRDGTEESASEHAS